MARFKIGQKVVALMDDTKPSYFKKGDVVEVRKLTRGINYKDLVVNGIHIKGSPYMYDESHFAPLANISDAIEYRLTVSIPELTEIKETQLQ